MVDPLRSRGLTHGRHDAGVGTAATQVPLQDIDNLFVARAGRFGEKCDTGHDHTGGAVAALERTRQGRPVAEDEADPRVQALRWSLSVGRQCCQSSRCRSAWPGYRSSRCTHHTVLHRTRTSCPSGQAHHEARSARSDRGLTRAGEVVPLTRSSCICAIGLLLGRARSNQGVVDSASGRISTLRNSTGWLSD